MTHLLHQMIHYRTTLRGSEQKSATVTRITIHTRNDIKYKKKVIRVWRHVVSPVGDPIHMQGWMQDGTPTQRRQVQSLDLPL